MRRFSSAISAAIMFSLLLSQVSPVLANALSNQIINIYDADDLYQLAKDCSYDKWSKDKTVALKADIDLGKAEFIPIPIFCGNFDGQGHTINGLSINVEGSNQGFIRYLQEGGVVKNLKVQGFVTPGGQKSNVGGLVGDNSGVLENCSFSGFVSGKDNVGGLVGLNGNTGLIINCSSNGVVHGKSKVGGITGFNTGTVLRSSNDANVNTTVEELQLDFQDLTIDNVNPFKTFIDAIDIGGIAGFNSGVVQSSENTGIVGYPHVGYNVGGIAGRQTGYMTECLNHGEVYGRKEVGGIVGQMEPYISTSMSPSGLRELQWALNNLQSSINTLLGHTQDTSNIINENLAFVQKDLNSTKAHAESLINQTETMLNQDIDEINKISIVAIEAMDRLVPVIEALDDTLAVMGRATYPMNRSLHYLSRAMGALPKFGDRYKLLADSMDDMLDLMLDVGDIAADAFSDLIKALELLYEGDMAQAIKLLNSVLEKLTEASGFMEEVVTELRVLMGHMTELIVILSDMGGDIGRALEYLQDAISIMEDAMDSIHEVLYGISDLLDYLSSQDELEFATTDKVFQGTKDNLFRSIDSLTDSSFQLIDIVKTQGDRLIEDIGRVSDDLFLVIDLALGLVSEVTEEGANLEEVVEDISREDIDKSTEGKVSNCKNFGVVDGDLNVGGVTGAMAFEFLLDAEEELSIKNKPTLRTVFKTRAVMVACENHGLVTAKKNNAGGIVGNMDLGYVTDCLGTGPVESIDGDYVGGIAGSAYGPINFSYSKALLSGGNYVGGIAGLGRELTNCYSMVRVDRGRACVGAVAGYAEKDSTIKGNYFVSNALAGIDGISYMDKAEPITYEELLEVQNLPEVFKQFTLSFWADDELVATLKFDYGGSVATEDIPEIPLKQGYYGRWKDLKTQGLTFDEDIKAEYVRYTGVLESRQKREGPLSVVLVEGRFSDTDILFLVEAENTGSEDIGTLVEQWRVEIPEDGNHIHTIRFIPPQNRGGYDVYLFEDEKWVNAHAKKDGKYLVFASSHNSVVFCIVKASTPYWKYLAPLGAALLVIAAYSYLKRRKVFIGKASNNPLK